MDVGSNGTGHRAVACRGIRGASTADRADQASVEDATAELLSEVLAANDLRPDDVAAAIFTLTEDLAGTNPAVAARANGWRAVPLLAVREHAGPATVARCVRVLLLANTERPQDEVRHVYLRDARGLRPDLAEGSSTW